MPSLTTTLRKQLEKAVCKARQVAEAGARPALEALAVHHYEHYTTLTKEQRALRVQLRAHGRQLGDEWDRHKDTQTIDKLVAECAYEHWHRMLFARFLAENDLLLEPKRRVPVSLEDCEELAREEKVDRWELASRYAQHMLPQIFRPDDPVLKVSFPREHLGKLEALLESLPSEIFRADDSLGWVYQFWREEEKEAVNASGKKIDADSLPAVTQLFTEDYMVEFLLHNTLGAWWVAKRKAEGKPVDPAQFRYLRLKEDASPAAGAFPGWPKTAKELKVLDPCMGSGHFLVFALPILVRFRQEEEGLSVAEACAAVLRDNLFGLEIDARCTQIGAFNLALATWKLGGHQPLPPLHLACSGLAPHASKEEWLALAGKEKRLRDGLDGLYELFRKAPILGSLINPRTVGGDLFLGGHAELQRLLEMAPRLKAGDEVAHELTVTAQGAAKAAEILAGKFTLVATNVPYLGRGKQDKILKEFCEQAYPAAKSDLATCFVQRSLSFCSPGGSTVLVTPQNWLFLGSYKKCRQSLLTEATWDAVARLGPHAFETITGEVVNVSLLALTRNAPPSGHAFVGLDVSAEGAPDRKAAGLSSNAIAHVRQAEQLKNPDQIITLEAAATISLLSNVGNAWQGISTSDGSRFQRSFFELPQVSGGWHYFQSTVFETIPYGGREFILFWEDGKGAMTEVCQDGAAFRGQSAWGRKGIVVSQMGNLPATIFSGERFDGNCAVLTLNDERLLPALWAYVESGEYARQVRRINQKLNVTNSILAKVPFDVEHWRKVATQKHSNALPAIAAVDPTQWLFSGHPKGSDHPLHVAVARLLGYRWPRQTGSSFPDCPALGPDGLEPHADTDGIVSLSAFRSEPPAAERLRALLSNAWGREWSTARERELIAATGSKAESLEVWLRDDFFTQHCALFHQRPFIWHVWDGRKDGFHALVNYHKLAGPAGEGQRTLGTLTYSYLGDWITRQKAALKEKEAGADARLAAAQELESELAKILAGEPPFDLFVRWKPLRQQPIGWDPDLNDGVRLNIRPFLSAALSHGRRGAGVLREKPNIKWDKDRGREPQRAKEDFPWFWGGKEFKGERLNDLHYTTAVKQAARERKGGAKT